MVASTKLESKLPFFPLRIYPIHGKKTQIIKSGIAHTISTLWEGSTLGEVVSSLKCREYRFLL